MVAGHQVQAGPPVPQSGPQIPQYRPPVPQTGPPVPQAGGPTAGLYSIPPPPLPKEIAAGARFQITKFRQKFT